MATVHCKTVAEYVNAIGPHDQHDTARTDRPQERLIGRACREHGVEAVISIADFKATGDLPEYEKLMKEKYPAPKKKKGE